ncbi:hypothetical protein F2P81_008198 [Scophthalmus maximus]|uniref:Cohesin subunit SA n=1 Tax=Scophthalmus maximus TaxID=52904 RepID=A0A6A4T1M0_SCOMX|nr:hypothetical protein F2P81_008198 [Scophthalmus maximus]
MASEALDSFEESDDFQDSGSDYEATIKASKRKKRAVLGPKAVVDEWLDSYKRGREVGLLVLINFIVQSCGCKGVVNREMLDSMENAEIISTLTKEFNEDSVNYPLSTPGPQLKRFKAGLCEFAQVVVRSCRNSLIYDEYLFPSLLAMLTGLSDSQVRAFRHTSTLLAMKLMTGLVEVAVIVSVQLQTTQRRHDMENSKKPHDRASDRLEELQATITELREKREELSSMMNATFRGVFVHRYRDRLPEIRVACIEELGKWLKTDPEDFLNDGCLKYLGWTLHDKVENTLDELKNTLQSLLDEEEGALIELMMCAIRQAAQGTPPVGRTQGKKMLSMKDKKIQEQDKRRITTHFIPLMPQLLTKYSADAGKVSLLLKAPLYFNLDMYNSAQWLEKHLDLLLSQVCGIVEKHTEATVLEACTHLVCALCSDTYTFSSRAHLAFSQLVDGLTECFSAYSSDLLQGTADENDLYSASTALKRIAALSCAKDLTGWKLFDPCVELLKSRLESRELDKEAELKRLKKDVRSFCRVCQTCLPLNQTEIRDQAFELLCDLLLLYSKSSVRSDPALQALVHLPSDTLRSEMAAFLLDFIFTESEDADLDVEGEEEMKITLLQRKRNQLAGYCKLVLYGVLDLTAATDVFKHYNKFFKDFGDIIKETMSKSKLISHVQSAKTVCLSLQQLFSEMLTENHSRQDLCEIRDLGKRLAMSFGIDLHRVRKPLVALHMDGIRFAFRDPQEGEEQLPHVTFLEILSEFSFKLLQQDRAQLGFCPPGSVSSTVRDSWLESSSIHSNLHTPALTSTVQRQPAKPLASGKPTATECDMGNGFTELESEDEFSSGSQMRKVKPVKRRLPSSSLTGASLDQQDLNSHLTLLSLIEDNSAEREEAEIEDYESDSDRDSAYTLVHPGDTQVVENPIIDFRAIPDKRGGNM